MKTIKTNQKATISYAKCYNFFMNCISQLNVINFNPSKSILLCALCILVSFNSRGQCGPGQNIIQNEWNSEFVANTNLSIGNSFVVPCNGKIKTISIWLHDVTQEGTGTLRLHLGDTQDNEIASKTLNVSRRNSSQRLNAVFSTPITVTAGTTYTFLFEPETVDNFRYEIATNNPYSQGNLISRGSGGNWTNNSGTPSDMRFKVSFVDEAPPTMVCQQISVPLNANGMASITVADIDGGTTDDSGGNVSLSINPSSFSCADLGENTVTLTGTDPSGNTASCSTVINVVDTMAPSLACQDIVLELGPDGNASITASQLVTSFSDNCDTNVELTLDIESFSCVNLGLNTVTVSATDASGNTSTCSANVSVTDSIVPLIACQDIEVVLNENGTAEIIAFQLDNGSTDNCGIELLVIDNTTFDCSNLGTNNVTLTAYDNSGNSSSCVAIVTVVDQSFPEITGPSNITQNSETNSCGAPIIYNFPEITDNCEASIEQIAGLPSNSIFPVGITTNTFVATDLSGNLTTFSFTVTIEDIGDPEIVCMSDITVDVDDSSCSAIVSYDAPSGSPFCSRTLTTTLSSNNSGQAGGVVYFDVAVGDITLLVDALEMNVFNPEMGDFTLEVFMTQAGETYEGNEADTSVWGTAVSTGFGSISNSDISLVTLDSPITLAANESYGFALVLDSATSHRYSNGNETNRIFQNPDLSLRLGSASNSPFMETIFNDRIFNGAFLYSYPVTIEQIAGLPSGSEFPVGVTTNTFQITNYNGNSSSCSFNVTVLDTLAPSITCSENIYASDQEATVVYPIPEVNDNCGFIKTNEYVLNGDFETGSLANWTTTLSENAEFIINDGTQIPTGPAEATTPINGEYDLLAYQSAEGSHNISQPILIPTGIIDAEISWYDRIRNYHSTFSDPSQEFRVNLLDGDGNLIYEIYSTRPGDQTFQIGPNFRVFNISKLLGSLEGQTVYLSFSQDAQNNFLLVNLDDISLKITSQNEVVQTAGLPSGSEFPVGTTTNVFEISDASGNTATCSFDVTILPSSTQIGTGILGETAGDLFGFSLEMNSDGTRMIVGGYAASPNGQSSGHASIYQWNGVVWEQMGESFEGEIAEEYLGLSVSINDSGNRIAIGVPGANTNGFDSGEVQVFDWNGSSWTQVGLSISGTEPSIFSGYSVNLSSSGEVLAIGSPNASNGDGQVSVYNWNGSVWQQVGENIEAVTESILLGISLDLNETGTRLIAGASQSSANGENSGEVRVYEWDGSLWKQLGANINGKMEYDFFGTSVSINKEGDRIIAGANQSNGNGYNSGEARIYDWDGTSWVQLGEDIYGEAANDLSGNSVCMSSDGNRIAIGAQGNNGNGSNSGHVRIYDWSGSSWERTFADIDGENENDISGFAVSLSDDGNRIGIGSPQSSINGPNSGQVRVFSLGSSNNESCVSTTTYTSSSGWDNGFPDATYKAIVLEDYSTSLGDIEACELVVSSGATLTVEPQSYVKVSHDITVDGSLLVAHGGSLVQVDETAVTINNGSISVEKQTDVMNDTDFSFMGSPMSTESTSGVYGSASLVRNHDTNLFTPNASVAIFDPGAENFADEEGDNWQNHTGSLTVGEGYLVKPYPVGSGTTGAYITTYSQGTLNSGLITFTAVYGDSQNDSPNILSNPYASAIDAFDFINSNALVDAVYYWEHISSPSSDYPGYNSSNYDMGDISMYNLSGGLSASNEQVGAPVSKPSNRFIASGQGFGIKANAAGMVSFTNGMRVTDNNDGYRNNEIVDRLYLSVSNSVYDLHAGTLIAFTAGATNGYDRNYDAKRLATSISLYSINEDRELGIQGRESFNVDDIIPLGFSTQVEESQEYVIGLDAIEGDGLTQSAVYLEDRLLQRVTNLKDTDYRFIADKGHQKDRFVLVFVSEQLGTTLWEENTVAIYPNPASSSIQISSPKSSIRNVIVYDVRGRELINEVVANQYNCSIMIEHLDSAMYFVKIDTEQGALTKRILKK